MLLIRSGSFCIVSVCVCSERQVRFLAVCHLNAVIFKHAQDLFPINWDANSSVCQLLSLCSKLIS